MSRDGLSAEEADQLIDEAREDFHARLEHGKVPMNLCEEWFGLEPDYLEEFLF